MNTTSAHITESSIVVVERNDANLVTRTVAWEDRPATLADADTFLAVHSLRRTAAWDLNPTGLMAPVAPIDNRFNGTVAARLDQAVGTTHTDFKMRLVINVNDGDLISDSELLEVYVVAGSSVESDSVKVHMVREGGTWEERYTNVFQDGLVMIARKR